MKGNKKGLGGLTEVVLAKRNDGSICYSISLTKPILLSHQALLRINTIIIAPP